MQLTISLEDPLDAFVLDMLEYDDDDQDTENEADKNEKDYDRCRIMSGGPEMARYLAAEFDWAAACPACPPGDHVELVVAGSNHNKDTHMAAHFYDRVRMPRRFTVWHLLHAMRAARRRPVTAPMRHDLQAMAVANPHAWDMDGMRDWSANPSQAAQPRGSYIRYGELSTGLTVERGPGGALEVHFWSHTS